MKKVFLLTFLFVLFTPFVSLASDIDIKLTAPTNGEKLTLTENYRIEWDSSSNVDKVSIGYKTCSSCLQWIESNIPNTGYYDWNVNTGNNVKTDLQIYIVGYDTGVGSADDVLDFSLASPFDDFEPGIKTGEDGSVKYLNLRAVPDELEEGEEMAIKFNDIGADYYVLTASCKDSTVVDGKSRPDLCTQGEQVYPTGKDVIAVYGFYPSVSGNSSTFQLRVTAYENDSKIKYDTDDVDIEDSYKYKKDYEVVGPKGKQYIGEGEIYLKWNNDHVVDLITLQDYKENDVLGVHARKVRDDEPITNGYYNLSDHYEDSTLEYYMKDGGEYRMHLTGPDGVDFYSDWFTVIYGKDQKTDNTKPKIEGTQKDIEILRLVVSILSSGNVDANTSELIQVLNLVIQILEA